MAISVKFCNNVYYNYLKSLGEFVWKQSKYFKVRFG